MEGKILVTYATTHGSTQEVAEAVAAVFREHELSVDLLPAKQVEKLDGYSAVVLGGPLYMFRWHNDARRFLSRHKKALCTGLPIAIFGGGPFGEDDPKAWEDVGKNLDKELAKFSWLTPVSVKVVGGKFDPTHLRFPWNLIPAMKQIPPSDLRDWWAIRDWAASLVSLFSTTHQPAEPV